MSAPQRCFAMSDAASLTASIVPGLPTLAPNARAPVRPTRSSARRISGWKMIGSAISRPVNELRSRKLSTRRSNTRAERERRDAAG